MALISVLIPAYRAQDTIVSAIQSLRAQTFGDWELVIASDDEFDYLSFYRSMGLGWDGQDMRQVFTATKASGPAAARNAALAVARGRFIAALDADDCWLPARLEKLLVTAEAEGVACDNVAAVTTDGQSLRFAFSEETLKAVHAGGMGETAVQIMDCGLPLHPVVARDFVGSGWRSELRFAEDVIFNLEVLSRAGGYALLPECLSHYVTRPGSICNRPGAWQEAERAYQQISTALLEARYELVDLVREVAIPAFQRKRAVNQAFGEAAVAGHCRSFQEFLAQMTPI